MSELKMTGLPKTIQIFLPDGNARSIRIADVTSRTVQAIQIPRTRIKEAGGRDEVNNVGVYFLFSDSDEDARGTVYIGEAEDCYTRLKQHHQQKENWSVAVAITSKTQSFTKAHVRFLEWLCYREAQEIDRFDRGNSTIPRKPHVPEAVQADLLDNFDTIRILLSTLGFPIFEPIAEKSSASTGLVFNCEGRGVKARGQYVDDGFVVFEGSRSAATMTKSAKGGWPENIRNKLLTAGILAPGASADTYVFTKDHLFNSPSGAAAAVLGRHANGWTTWKRDDGRTLDEIARATGSDDE